MKSFAALVIAVTAAANGTVDLNANAQSSRNSSGKQRIPANSVEAASPFASREVYFYSEGIRCYAKIFTPNGFSGESKAPAIVLAPGWGQTSDSLDRLAALFAARGLVAMTIDYRGWGKSGGFLQVKDDVKTDDRLRFSELTSRVIIRRKRLIPQHQVLDIRNALYFLQGEPGIDRARVGVWGIEMSGGHAITIAATDVRVTAVVAVAPIISGKYKPKRASAPSGDLLRSELRRARVGVANVRSGLEANHTETNLALADYHPFWLLEHVPQKTAVLFVVAEGESEQSDSIAASKLLRGPTTVMTAPGLGKIKPRARAVESAVTAVADWFLKHL
jgi:dienelactone hydrolase